MRGQVLILPVTACALISGCVTYQSSPYLELTPLQQAASNGDTVQVDALMAQGADPGAIAPNRSDAISPALRNHPEIARRMLQHCLALYVPGKSCPLALAHVAWLGDLELGKAFLAKGAKADSHQLRVAAMSGHEDMARLLLAHGADADVALAGLEQEAAQHTMALQRFAEEASKPDRNYDQIRSFSAHYENDLRTVKQASAMLKRLQEERETAARGQPEEPAASGALSLLSDVDKPAYAKPALQDGYAMVVGIEKYADLPDARFAERDAKAVREHLLALGYPERNVVLLTGQQASRAGLVKNLETWLVRNVDERSTVFFYYAGYGAPDPQTGQPYLLPSDGDPQYLDDTAYPLKRLYDKLGGIKAKRVTIVLDACFSGAGGRSVLAKGTKPLLTKVGAGLGASGKIVSLSASASDQIAWLAADQQHGLFTYYFLRGLNGAAASPDGVVTMQGLYDYLSLKVQDSARRDNREQTPQLLSGASDAANVRLR